MHDFVIDFAGIATTSGLARAIGCSDDLIDRAVEFNSRPLPTAPTPDATRRLMQLPGLHYVTHLPKKHRRQQGKTRTVLVVEDTALAVALKALARRLELFFRAHVDGFPTQACKGFLLGSSTRGNAEPHLGARRLVNADIRDFFASISTERVVSALQSAGLRSEAAITLGHFVTVRGSLPLGFSTSPLLSNLVCMDLDARLSALATRCGAAYTRYADDLAFSGNGELPTRGEIRAILEEDGFALAEEKFRSRKRGQSQFVTGLSIADSARPRVPKGMKRAMRQHLYFCRKYGIVSHADAVSGGLQTVVNRIDGRIGYIQGIEPDLGSRLRAEWRQTCSAADVRVAYDRQVSSAPPITLLVDESEWTVPGRRMFALACVELEDSDLLRKAIGALTAQRAGDPFYGGRQKTFSKRGFHFADDPERAREDFCRLLSEYPLRAFLAFVERRDEAFEDRYLRLFGWLLRQRLMAAKGRDVAIVCDPHSSLGQHALTSEVERVFGMLRFHGMRNTLAVPHVLCPSKLREPLLAVPDYMLGVFTKYASRGSAAREHLEVRRFEQLRDKYRLIQNFDAHESFNRSRTFLPFGMNVGDPAHGGGTGKLMMERE